MTIVSILSDFWRGGGLLKPPPQAQEQGLYGLQGLYGISFFCLRLRFRLRR